MDNNMMKNRTDTALAVVVSINTTARKGDKIVGAFLDIDQGYLELEDGTGYRMSLGPVTKTGLAGVKKRLKMEE